MGAKHGPLVDRLMDKVLGEPNSGCWLWMGYILPDGYGRIWGGKDIGRNLGTHQAAYTVFVGPIPPGMFVCHKCDTPACIRPDHLFLGTCQDNANDMVSKKRHKFGSRIARTNLTEQQVSDILSDLRSYPEIAKDYGVTEDVICRIQIGRSWKHVDGTRIRRGQVRGTRAHAAKLTESDIPLIRSDTRPLLQIAKAYGVSWTAIKAIKSGKSWRHVDE